MSVTMPRETLSREVEKRRTFAIISHPDAGKTTLTEKLLLYGGAIHLAGAVKARKAQRHATSDWMELERQRGISITSSVLQFPYREYRVNLLDTPGHQDFSEDTYRTLTAVDSAVMLIDAAKGVEPQTEKLFHVCRLRGIPIVTFMNKLDRYGQDPFSLLEELERVLGIRSSPINWPIGMGRDFRGVYDRQGKRLLFFEATDHGQNKGESRQVDLADPSVADLIGVDAYTRLREEIELLDVAGDPFDAERVRRGGLTPVFFGSALTNFGVQPFFDAFLELAPPPGPRATEQGLVISPEDDRFSAFVFKIQANMNPAHRDRIAFLRICSGHFTRGMEVRHVRLGKAIKLAQPQQFLAQDRTIIEEAYPGDIIGVFDPGIFQIGDTLCAGDPITYAGIPHFSPEHFATVRLRDAMKRKQLLKGLEQLSQEGAIQIFRPWEWGATDHILGAVGALQFDVLEYRLKFEYGVDASLERLPYTLARWVEGEGFDSAKFGRGETTCVKDRADRPVILFKTEWALRWVEREHPRLRLATTAGQGAGG